MDTNRQVTAQEIEKLYKFTRQHFVEHFDVQAELVDHLASSIEDMWTENPKTKFDVALDKTFKKFGVFGFSDVVEDKTSALSKKYTKRIFRYAFERLKWPNILASLVLSIILYYTVAFFDYSGYTIVAMYSVGAFLAFIKLYSFHKKWKRKTNGVKLLAIQMSIKAPGALIYFTYLLFVNPMLSLAENGSFEAHSWSLITASFLFALFSLVVFDSIRGLEDEIEENYNKYLAVV